MDISITQDMRFRQSLMNYAARHGVSKAFNKKFEFRFNSIYSDVATIIIQFILPHVKWDIVL